VGASPARRFQELYTALERGLVDDQRNQQDVLDLRLYEVQKFLTEPPW
jgi:TRAP-type C4-dicarboxylate transport system substrate-binding protein